MDGSVSEPRYAGSSDLLTHSSDGRIDHLTFQKADSAKADSAFLIIKKADS